MKSTMNKNTKICTKCGSNNMKARSVTYPLKTGDKEINIGRVSVKMCMYCHDIRPTKSGKEKIARCMMRFMSMFR